MREGLTENRRKVGMSPAVWDHSQGIRILVNANRQTDGHSQALPRARMAGVY